MTYGNEYDWKDRIKFTIQGLTKGAIKPLDVVTIQVIVTEENRKNLSKGMWQSHQFGWVLNNIAFNWLALKFMI